MKERKSQPSRGARPVATIAEGNRRLLALAKLLDKLPPDRFDYRQWVGDDWKGKPDLSCGAPACALGWATTMPKLRALGLRLVRSSGFGSYVTLGRSRAVCDYEEVGHSLRVACTVFCLKEQEAILLFVPRDDIFRLRSAKPGARATAQEVAAHIRNFVVKRRSKAATLPSRRDRRESST